MDWYYSQNGAQHGPVPEQELKNLIANQQIRTTDMAWHDGMPNWLPISQVPELAALAAPQTTPTAASAPGQAVAAQPSPYQTPQAAPQFNTGAPQHHIPNYLWQSIVVTLLCCLPAGIVAIVYAAKVDGLKAAGDWHAAKAASDNAKTWCLWSVGLTLAVFVIYFFIGIAGGLAGM
ncbi:CD225/dispanin family protein [Verrucomicrobiaceae bacterium N1E253]|uniref:CD225/dispanin family protein n=1 Tax=Oceaniferula marina TaxID=2748318 RepID=A0A851G8I2_9BACT|nr:CD225/dispanin family protein [Oceaniferula marina]NWK54018.1 CD225/dispanin family protein [Oceaniferula marina]